MLARSFAFLAFLAAGISLVGHASTVVAQAPAQGSERAVPLKWTSPGGAASPDHAGTASIRSRVIAASATSTNGKAAGGAATEATASGNSTGAAGTATATKMAPTGQATALPPDQPPPRATRVTTGNGELPNEHGQLYREYDISPYTLRVTSTNRPELAIVDWILRETGYEAWHSDTLSVLSPTPRKLRVYHTPAMHEVVGNIVERFVRTEGETHGFGLRVVTLSHPNWRARARHLMQPVPVQTPGVQAWLMHREHAAMLLAELRRRSDYREQSSPQLMVSNGQSTVVSVSRERSYVRDVVLRNDGFQGIEPDTALFDEGFSLEFSPLLSIDEKKIDATIKCEIDQMEKLVSVGLDLPTSATSTQRTKIEAPQISHFRFHERFRWPVDQVLLVGMGMVPLPIPGESQQLIPGLPIRLPSGGPPRADVLVFVESKGKGSQPPRMTKRGPSVPGDYRGPR